ncbi:hypothetical protein [Flavobacterium covae]|uniref:hypothetical protein n=1 Tax=Flavobacterium covae TaxID=2906076 RepID=UPI001FB6EB5A|nr:hypothetical protein [Flavobacterium covae]
MFLLKYSELAYLILNNNTRYKNNKEIIGEIFKLEHPNKVQFRLTVIDSYYSTQMSKRLYGIEKIAEVLETKTDNQLIDEINLFLANQDSSIFLKEVFSKKYGINKQGEEFGKAISLISKYCYFLNNYNFPIYDTIAKIAYPLLTNGKKINEDNYFSAIKELNIISGINNYEKLDNLMWLVGKIRSSSFSILMDINKYKTITENIPFLTNDSSKEKDDKIRKYIEKTYKTSDIFDINEKDFLDFTFNLK